MALLLVTGGAGFIGSHLAEALIRGGHEVRCLDNFTTGRRENIVNFLDKVQLTETDLRDVGAVQQACQGVDTIFHLAALPSVPRSIKDPGASHDVNLTGTFNVLEGARAAGVRRVVYAASSSAYGDQLGFPRRETMRTEPISPYAVQKLAGELYMQTYWRVYGIETVCLRYFNIFGPRQVPDSPYSGVMARWILQMIRGERPIIFGDGEQGRDFTYVANAVEANLRALDAPVERVAGCVFNVACGERHTLNESYRSLSRLLKYSCEPNYVEERPGDVRDSMADVAMAKEAMGYVPRIGFEEGLRLTVDWYRIEYGVQE